MNRFGMCTLDDWKKTVSLVGRLIEDGAVADQLVVLAFHTDVDPDDTPDGLPISLYAVLDGQGMQAWAVREPHYYSGGIRDDRRMRINLLRWIDSISRHEAELCRKARALVPRGHHPVLVVELNRSSKVARIQVSALLDCALSQVVLLDLPLKDQSVSRLAPGMESSAHHHYLSIH